MALAFKEIDSINSSMKLFETIINNEKDVKPVDYLNLSQLQDMNGMYKEANKNKARNFYGTAFAKFTAQNTITVVA